ncbi:auxin efflux carrier [Lactarius sanguifluus]|nr:auxin efflux carrier [Lactarius sanguifluus]
MSSSSPPGDTPIWPLFQTILGSITQVILVCVSGYVLARRGILDKSTQKVAFFLSPAKLRELWIIPIFFLLVSGVSLVVAWFLGNVFRPPALTKVCHFILDTHIVLHPRRNFAMAAATFMNSNSLPVALLQSLAATVPGLRWGEDDTKDAIIGRALTYLLLCSTIGQFLRWSYGVHLLSKADPLEEEIGNTSGFQDDATSTHEVADSEHLFGIFRDSHDHTTSLQLRPRTCVLRIVDILPPSSTPFPALLSSMPSIYPPSLKPILYPTQTRIPTDDELQIPVWSRPSPTFLQRVGRSVTNFLTPPLWASLISLAVALNQPLQHVLEVHLHPVQGAITQAGNCSIPVTLVVLGAISTAPSWRRASFASSLREIFRLKAREEDRRSRVQQRVGKGEGRTIFVAIFARMIVVPRFVPPVHGLRRTPGSPARVSRVSSPSRSTCPVFILSNVLLLASPPALTLAQITQAVSSDTFERLISRTIFWSYCFVTPPAMVGYAVVAMLITKL